MPSGCTPKLIDVVEVPVVEDDVVTAPKRSTAAYTQSVGENFELYTPIQRPPVGARASPSAFAPAPEAKKTPVDAPTSSRNSMTFGQPPASCTKGRIARTVVAPAGMKLSWHVEHRGTVAPT